jgi:hypothetical protein
VLVLNRWITQYAITVKFASDAFPWFDDWYNSGMAPWVPNDMCHKCSLKSNENTFACWYRFWEVPETRKLFNLNVNTMKRPLIKRLQEMAAVWWQ